LGVGQPLDGHVTALDGLRSFPVWTINDFASERKVALLGPVEKRISNSAQAFGDGCEARRLVPHGTAFPCSGFQSAHSISPTKRAEA
jgi:hypothetical protein